MQKRLAFLFLSGVLIVTLLGVPQPATAAALPATVKGQYIVVYKDDVVDPTVATNEIVGAQGLSLLFEYSSALKGFAAFIPDAKLEAVKNDPRVEFISEDQMVQAAGMVKLAKGDKIPTGVRRISAATATTVHQASTVNVAVIDTGIILSSKDLYAVSGKNCVRAGRLAIDDNGHGSHVAGTIAARNNGSGVVGVAPGTKVYAVKVLNSAGSGTWSQVICGIDWVTANAARLKIKVVNMSLGGGGSNDNNCGKTNGDAFHQAICRSVAAGVTYVVAAGNGAVDLDTFVPAAYPEVLSVTAVTDSDGKAGGVGGSPACRYGEVDDQYASFSNYAVSDIAINHAIAAPGVCILSDWKTGYNTISGTSMAAPHVTGSVALCFGNGGKAGPCTGLTPDQVIQKLRGDAAAHADASNGFSGDPNHPVSGKNLGYLVWAGGY
jgi:subtilisin family serine protease